MKALLGFRVFVLAGLVLLYRVPGRAETLFREGAPDLARLESGFDDKTVANTRQFPHFSTLIKELSPAVVNISVEGEKEGEAAIKGLPFFNHGPGSMLKSLGSGFVVHEDGYIVTNFHVVEGASRILVRMYEEKTDREAKLVGADSKTDLALIKVDGVGKLKTVFLGNSDDLEIGEWVIAIGNQFQLGQSVTAGIVSAKSRRVPSGTAGPYDAFIQTDASINPGSSGGPLFNTRGQVIGINTAIFSPGKTHLGAPGFNIGIGFAIPVNLIKSIVPQLKEQGKVTRGLLGVKIQPVTPDLATLLRLDGSSGALVADIMKNTPASAAGFQRKDVIVKYDGRDVKEYEDLPLMVASTPVGTQVEVVIVRAGQHKSITVQIQEFKEVIPVTLEKSETPNQIGIIVDVLTSEKVRALNLERAAGVVVSRVEDGSEAEEAGISVGDVIEEFAGQPLSDPLELDRLVNAMKKDQPVMAVIRKSEGTRIISLKIK